MDPTPAPRWRTPLAAAAAAAGPVVLLVALVLAPPAANFAAPLSQRLLYLHVPTAWAAYLAFGLTAAGSVRVLLHEGPGVPRRADRWAAAGAEVGTLFATVALTTGLLWARLEFAGYDPFADPKVLTLLVLLLAYVGYLLLRAGVDDPERRARLAAVHGAAALVAVPLSYLASRVSLHPDFARPDQSLAPDLAVLLLASLAAVTLLGAHLVAHRARLARVRREVDVLHGRLRREGSP